MEAYEDKRCLCYINKSRTPMSGKINFIKLKVPLTRNLPPCKLLNGISDLNISLVSVIKGL